TNAHGLVTITDASTGAYSYTPASNFNGTASFTFSASDGSLSSNVATISITVSPVNDAPLAANGSLTTPEDTAKNGSVSATDAENDPLTYALVGDVSHGTLTFNSDGTFSYTPALNYNGPDSFTFRANDGVVD